MKKLKYLILPLGLLLIAATPGLASVAAADGEVHYPWMDLVFRVVNFIIVVGIIWFAAGKMISGGLRGRREGIANELSDLETRKAEAQKKLRDVEQGIANMEEERKKILDDYKAQGEALKDSIIAKAKESADQIKAQAELSASQEAKYAVEQMRVEMADMVVEAAQKLLAEKLTADEHEKLVDKYLEKVVLN